jgi:putative endonuclease
MTGKSSHNRSKGRIAESIASRYLISQSWKILERNSFFSGGELDLVAKDPAGVLVFVEVKSSWSKNGGRPAAQVHKAKQRLIWRAAQMWLARTGTHDQQMRFDVLCVRFIRGIPEIELICDAFMGPSSGY